MSHADFLLLAYGATLVLLAAEVIALVRRAKRSGRE